MCKKLVISGMILIMCMSVLTACKDYGYEYHFSVVGENGSLSAEGYETSPIILLGGKRGSHQLKFTAIPESGYQVKEWRYNGEIMEDNRSNFFITTAVDYKQPIITVTVEFEPVS